MSRTGTDRTRRPKLCWRCYRMFQPNWARSVCVASRLILVVVFGRVKVVGQLGRPHELAEELEVVEAPAVLGAMRHVERLDRHLLELPLVGASAAQPAVRLDAVRRQTDPTVHVPHGPDDEVRPEGVAAANDERLQPDMVAGVRVRIAEECGRDDVPFDFEVPEVAQLGSQVVDWERRIAVMEAPT